jgi:hypothetical protein
MRKMSDVFKVGSYQYDSKLGSPLEHGLYIDLR